MTITIDEGSKEFPPYVMVEIFPGKWPFEYWYEVSHWSPEEQCWYHDYSRDGGAFGWWRVLRKAREAKSDLWYELLDKNNAQGSPGQGPK